MWLYDGSPETRTNRLSRWREAGCLEQGMCSGQSAAQKWCSVAGEARSRPVSAPWFSVVTSVRREHVLPENETFAM